MLDRREILDGAGGAHEKMACSSYVGRTDFVCSERAIADDATECEAAVKKTVTMCKERGRQGALMVIDDPAGSFVRGELYVFALSLSMNVVEAHPRDKSLKRMPMGNVADAKGQKFKEVAEDLGSGWVDYTWAKPGETEAKPKRSLIMRVPDADLYFGAGYYLK
jgi:signal transduction histidine kinase